MAESPIEQALSIHQSGDLDAAEQAYLDILMDDSRNAEALKLIGLLACQRGKLEDGLNYLEAAIEVDDSVAEYHFALAHGYLASGKIDEGIASLARAGEIDPSRADVYGTLGDTYQKVLNFPEALRMYQHAMTVDAANINYRIGAGLSAIFSGQHDIAAEYLEQAAVERDDVPQVYYGLALIKAEAGDNKSAHDLMSKAVALDAANPEYLRLLSEYASA
ncbi:MAG: tetratricopeptide repeat protein [Alphaproteobacteria bacterium]|nr:tetratricopeptide repeat protein [Alphaproteobacteria bacterium]